MKKYYADKTCLNLIRIIILVFTLALICGIYYLLHTLPIIMWILIALFGLAYLAVVVIWLPLYFANANYIISANEIIRNTGFFLRMKQVMPMESVQYVTITTTVFSKYTGLNFVIVNALGGSVLLMFLTKSDALEILQTIRSAIDKRK